MQSMGLFMDFEFFWLRHGKGPLGKMESNIYNQVRKSHRWILIICEVERGKDQGSFQMQSRAYLNSAFNF